MKRLIVDLDHTLCMPEGDQDQAQDPSLRYRHAKPATEVIRQLRHYRSLGFEIVIHTSRNMRTFAGDVAAIRQHTLPIVLDWLAEHDVPYDEIVVGKPWCGFEGFYIDDRAIRPSEFVTLSYDEIVSLIHRERVGG
ncbi:hypothetical protein [uncultured Enterovirga sp.]|uniref:hypothetical protein n=1 Tax=uncultured Enterovirga sp. TaxID=2026352 RepID=UPI0035CB41FC